MLEIIIVLSLVGEHNGKNPIHIMSQHTSSSFNAARAIELEVVEDVNVSFLQIRNSYS